MAGFPREEQKLLAIMVGSHRRKPALEEADELAPPWDKRAPPMTFLLRHGGAAASGTQQRRAAGDQADVARRFARAAISARLARRSPADRRRPADRDRAPQERRFPPARVQREVDAVRRR